MIQIDTQTASFANQSSKTITFGLTFYGTPTVNAIPVDTDVEIFVSSITGTGCTLNSSAPFTGNVAVTAVRG
jgi:hypothetical protein